MQQTRNIFTSVTTGDAITVDFIGELTTLDSTGTLRFGRDSDLVVDEDNQHLHRELGEFKYLNGQWWLRNIGRSIPLRLWHTEGTARSVVMSGSEVPITAKSTTIEFEAGRFRYELTVHLDNDRVPIATQGRSDTISATDLPLTVSQKQLIVSLAARALENPGSAITVPASKEAAARLGWKMTKFNAKLQNVCEKFAALGVQGLSADLGGSNVMDRRLRLVEYCIFNGVVSATDLELLAETD